MTGFDAFFYGSLAFMVVLLILAGIVVWRVKHGLM